FPRPPRPPLFPYTTLFRSANRQSATSTVAPRRPALSPSRAADFKQCPLLYRFRVVDRLPETPSRAQVRGTVVHAVLERLFTLPADRKSTRLNSSHSQISYA